MEWFKQNLVGIIGTLISIGSAIFSLIQAKKANQEKKEAIKVKEDIIKRYTDYNDSQLRTKIESVLRNLNGFRGRKNIEDSSKIGKNEYSDVTELLILIRSQKIFEEQEIKENVEACEKITQSNDFNQQSISELINRLANIQRFIDKSIKRM